MNSFDEIKFYRVKQKTFKTAQTQRKMNKRRNGNL